jgi:PAS domain S-box-containing protein
MTPSLSLLDFISPEKMDKILKNFTDATGVASIIANVNGYPITKPHNFTPFCLQYCRSTAEGKHLCHLSDRYGGRESLRSGELPTIYHCLNAGLMDCAAPVIVKGRHLATILCGQVLEEPLRRDIASKRASTIGVLDIDGYLNTLNSVPLMSHERLFNIANLMTVITQIISELALQKFLQKRNSDRYLNKIINSISDCLISLDINGIISMINEAGLEMFGYKDEELIGRSILTLFSDEASKTTYREKLERERTGDQKIVLTGLKADDHAFPVQVSIAGIDKHKSKAPNYVTIIRDISEERQAEAMKEDLIGMVTHDMKNPVLSLQKAIELMVSGSIGSLNVNQLEIMNLALDTTHQLFSMVSNLLDVYLKENGQFLLYKSPIDIYQIINQSIDHLTFLAREKQVKVRFAPSPASLMLVGDPDRILRTLINIIGNAMKLSPAGEEVRISLTPVSQEKVGELVGFRGLPQLENIPEAGQYVLISVTDQGPGIPEIYHQAIFDKFFSAKTKDDLTRKGTGLGLTFCKQVIEAHGGAIWVESPTMTDENGGTRGCEMQFLLPVSPIGP